MASALLAFSTVGDRPPRKATPKFLTHRNQQTRNVCYFKPLNLGVICTQHYTTTTGVLQVSWIHHLMLSSFLEISQPSSLEMFLLPQSVSILLQGSQLLCQTAWCCSAVIGCSLCSFEHLPNQPRRVPSPLKTPIPAEHHPLL